VRFVHGDFFDTADVARALDGVDVAYNLVSAFNPASAWERPGEVLQRDAMGAVRFFEACVDHGVSKVVYTSSGGTIYGPRPGRIAEDALPRPFNPHAICKLAVEHFLEYFRVRHAMAGDVYRISNVFGPRQPLVSNQGVIAVWMRRILDGEPVDVFGDENTLRDYIYVEDATLLMTHSLADTTASDTFNLGTGVGVSILDLLELFREVAGADFEARRHPRRPSDNTSAVMDNSKILALYPDFSFRDLGEMLARTWELVRAERGSPIRG
jgi:UDP-glucose 4-epimerase